MKSEPQDDSHSAGRTVLVYYTVYVISGTNRFLSTCLCKCLVLDLLRGVVRTSFEWKCLWVLPGAFCVEAIAIVLLWYKLLIAFFSFHIIWKPPDALFLDALELLIRELPWRDGKLVKLRRRSRMKMEPWS